MGKISLKRAEQVAPGSGDWYGRTARSDFASVRPFCV